MPDDPRTYTQDEVDALIAERNKALEDNRNEVLRELRKAQSGLKKWEGRDPEKYDELVAQAEEAERQRAAKEGDFKKLESQLIERHGVELKGRDDRIGKLTKALEDRAVRAELQAALVKAGAFKDELDLLTDYGMRFGRLVETETGFAAELFENGSRMVADGRGTPMDFETFAQQVVKQKYPRLFEGSGSSGGGAPPKSAPGGGGNKQRVQYGDHAAFLGNLDAIADGKVQVDMPGA